MKKTKLFILTLLLFAGQLVLAQTDTNFEILISKEWKMDSYEVGEKKILPTEKQKSDRMIFYANHDVESIDSGRIDKGIWKYDSNTKTITMIDNATKTQMPFQIIKLTSSEFVVEIKNPNGAILKIYMSPAVHKN